MSWLACGVVPRRSRVAVRASALAIVAAALGGCSEPDSTPRDGLEPDTARFTYGGRTAEVSLTACGREDDVVVLAGTEGGIVVQAEADVGEGGAARTGVTADVGDDGILGAFGAEMEHGPAGEVTDVRVEGDRLIIEGRWVSFDEQLAAQPAPGGEIDGRLVARCPDSQDETATPHEP